MQKYEGRLIELGPSEGKNGGGARYMFIKIGDQIVKDVTIGGKLNPILQGEIRTGYQGNQALYLKKIFGKKRIIAIAAADGQVYKLKSLWKLWIAITLGGILLAPVGFGFIFLFVSLLTLPLTLGLRCLKDIKADYEV